MIEKINELNIDYYEKFFIHLLAYGRIPTVECFDTRPATNPNLCKFRPKNPFVNKLGCKRKNCELQDDQINQNIFPVVNEYANWKTNPVTPSYQKN